MIKVALIALAAATLASCGGPAKRTENREERTVLCGGFTDLRTPTEQEKELFRTVTAGLVGVSYTPEQVSTQIVAGTNYRFVCKAVSATLPAETYQAEVVVYQPLPGQGEARITGIKRL